MICSGRTYLLLQPKFKIKLDTRHYLYHSDMKTIYRDEQVKVYNPGTRNCILRNNMLLKNISMSANMETEHVTLHETKGIQLKLAS
jgi:hypothetical protein